MWHSLAAAIDAEREQVRRLTSEFGPLVGQALQSDPSTTDRAALATMLHSYYGGLERVMGLIAMHLDGGLQKTPSWHSDLLGLMTKPTANRPALWTPEVGRMLREYLGFRHVFRSHYAFEIQWSGMRPLVERFGQSASSADDALADFAAWLRSQG